MHPQPTIQPERDTMSINNPVYGELLTAKEVCQVTGFTMNQLRNWRTPARHELAPFGYVSIGITPYYRKVVVQAWLDRNGMQAATYVMADIDKEFPIAIAENLSIEKSNATASLSAVTTENVYHWLMAQTTKNPAFISAVWRDTWAKTGEPYVKYNDRHTDRSWYAPAVLAQRIYINEEQNFGLSLDELRAIPTGNVPPLNEKQ